MERIGQCHCGSLRVIATGEPDRVYLCHTLLHGSAGLRVLGPGSVEHHSPFGERDFLESLV
jgi:hypothetical protein